MDELLGQRNRPAELALAFLVFIVTGALTPLPPPLRSFRF